MHEAFIIRNDVRKENSGSESEFRIGLLYETQSSECLKTERHHENESGLIFQILLASMICIHTTDGISGTILLERQKSVQK